MSRVAAVIGGGRWGTTIAHLIGSNGYPVRLWCRSSDKAAEINGQHTNCGCLGEHRLSESISATTDLADATRNAPLVFMAVPSQAFRLTARAIGDVCRPDQYVIHGTKGLEPGTHCRMSEILLQETCVRQVGVLSGPNVAPELCAGKPAGTVVASRFPRVCEHVRGLLGSDHLRVYATDDVPGVEVNGALKNVVAIAAGMAAHMQLGENARALLIARGLAEIGRVGVALGAQALTLVGLAGVGDLVATCSSAFSPNQQVGRRLAEGEQLQDILRDIGQVVEGVSTAQVAHEIITERTIRAPLLEAVYRVLYEGLSPADALAHLMRLDPRDYQQ